MKLSELIKELQELEKILEYQDTEVTFVAHYIEYRNEHDYMGSDVELERYSAKLNICGTKKKRYVKIELE